MKKLYAVCLPLSAILVLNLNSTQAKIETIKKTTEIVIEGDYDLVQITKTFDKLIEEENQRRIKEAEEEAERQRLEALKVPTYNPYDLRERSNLTKEQMHQMLSGTALETLVDAYYWYEQVYNVNAIFMMSLNAHESAWGRSTLAIEKNNLGGYKASDGSFRYFDDWGQFLDENFRLISDEYLDPNGLFYNGIDIYSVNINYCTEPSDYSWSEGINAIAYELLNKLYK